MPHLPLNAKFETSSSTFVYELKVYSQAVNFWPYMNVHVSKKRELIGGSQAACPAFRRTSAF